MKEKRIFSSLLFFFFFFCLLTFLLLFRDWSSTNSSGEDNNTFPKILLSQKERDSFCSREINFPELEKWEKKAGQWPWCHVHLWRPFLLSSLFGFETIQFDEFSTERRRLKMGCLGHQKEEKEKEEGEEGFYLENDFLENDFLERNKNSSKVRKTKSRQKEKEKEKEKERKGKGFGREISLVFVSWDRRRGFFSLFRDVLAAISLSIQNSRFPVIIWDVSGYNSWLYDFPHHTWFQNSSTGYGVDNLWTYLFVPTISYQNYHQYIRPQPPTEISLQTQQQIKKGYVPLPTDKEWKREPFFYPNRKLLENHHTLWATQHLHPRIFSFLHSFHSSHLLGQFVIGVHFRGTDRFIEFKSFYNKLISASLSVRQKVIAAGVDPDQITFLISSDSWVLLQKAWFELKNVSKVVYLPGIGRSATSQPIHLSFAGDPFRYPLTPLESILFPLCLKSKNYSTVFVDCLKTSNPEWYCRDFDSGARPEHVSLFAKKRQEELKRRSKKSKKDKTLWCSQVESVRPSFLMAQDALAEALVLSLTHFYLSFSGNFASAPYLFNSLLPGIIFANRESEKAVVSQNALLIPIETQHKEEGEREIVLPCDHQSYFKRFAARQKRERKEKEKII